MFQLKLLGEIKTHVSYSVSGFPKSICLRKNVEYYCKAGRPHVKIRRMRTASWMSKATDPYPEYVIFNAFCNNNSLNRAILFEANMYIDFLVVLT
jgi:hypothetical protein